MSENKSYFQTHPTLRRVLWWALTIATIVIFALIFGPDRVWTLVEPLTQGVAQLLGINPSEAKP